MVSNIAIEATFSTTVARATVTLFLHLNFIYCKYMYCRYICFDIVVVRNSRTQILLLDAATALYNIDKSLRETFQRIKKYSTFASMRAQTICGFCFNI